MPFFFKETPRRQLSWKVELNSTSTHETMFIGSINCLYLSSNKKEFRTTVIFLGGEKVLYGFPSRPVTIARQDWVRRVYTIGLVERAVSLCGDKTGT
jgi:hypothetical protein